MSVRYADRQANHPVRLQVTLRELRKALWPNSYRGIQADRVRRQLHAAADALDSWKAAWPWHDAETGRGGEKRVVLVSGIGYKLDDTLDIVVDLPPGAADGPVVSPNLHSWGARNAPAFRALIGLAYEWHEPGRTHHPIRTRGRPDYWARVYEPDRYRELSDDDVIAMTFPTSTRKKRRNLASEGWAALRALEEAGELRLEGRRALPPSRPPNLD